MISLLSKKLQKQSSFRKVRLLFALVLLLIFLSVYAVRLSENQRVELNLGSNTVYLPFPQFVDSIERDGEPIEEGYDYLHPQIEGIIEEYKETLIQERRRTQINKVERFLKSYGSKLAGYGDIIVDQAEACGGDYRILIGIAGSESGLGRVMYKKYNPYGYLDGVQYKNQEQALKVLSCKVSKQHIAPCGENLWCLVRRYGGSNTNQAHFVNKVRWFMDQVD